MYECVPLLCNCLSAVHKYKCSGSVICLCGRGLHLLVRALALPTRSTSSPSSQKPWLLKGSFHHWTTPLFGFPPLTSYSRLLSIPLLTGFCSNSQMDGSFSRFQKTFTACTFLFIYAMLDKQACALPMVCILLIWWQTDTMYLGILRLRVLVPCCKRLCLDVAMSSGGHVILLQPSGSTITECVCVLAAASVDTGVQGEGMIGNQQSTKVLP